MNIKSQLASKHFTTLLGCGGILLGAQNHDVVSISPPMYGTGNWASFGCGTTQHSRPTYSDQRMSWVKIVQYDQLRSSMSACVISPDLTQDEQSVLTPTRDRSAYGFTEEAGCTHELG